MRFLTLHDGRLLSSRWIVSLRESRHNSDVWEVTYTYGNGPLDDTARREEVGFFLGAIDHEEAEG